MIRPPDRTYDWMRMFELDDRAAKHIVSALAPFHDSELLLGSFGDGRDPASRGVVFVRIDGATVSWWDEAS